MWRQPSTDLIVQLCGPQPVRQSAYAQAYERGDDVLGATSVGVRNPGYECQLPVRPGARFGEAALGNGDFCLSLIRIGAQHGIAVLFGELHRLLRGGSAPRGSSDAHAATAAARASDPGSASSSAFSIHCSTTSGDGGCFQMYGRLPSRLSSSVEARR